MGAPYPARRRLLRNFFARPTLEVAPDLLGHIIVVRTTRTLLAARLVEVEAYLGVGEDPASHAQRGETPRNLQMFETPGRLYVYFTYGMHHCMNVVCESEGRAGAVLLRAGEPLAGESLMARRRGRKGLDLANGPAKLCQALGIDRRHDGLDLVTGPVGIWPGTPPDAIERSSRVGIRQGTDLLFRFFDPSSPHISPGPPS
ncbi:MAG: DNA-3-methyladenine glycosylase [Gemmatimonadetes bacterium]|nr:DNA-3-methyladenine glycosylase [Gemmatimonadota bacterium]